MLIRAARCYHVLVKEGHLLWYLCWILLLLNDLHVLKLQLVNMFQNYPQAGVPRRIHRCSWCSESNPPCRATSRPRWNQRIEFASAQTFRPKHGGSLAMDFLIPFCRIAVSELHTAVDDVDHETKFLIALGLHCLLFPLSFSNARMNWVASVWQLSQRSRNINFEL